MINESISDIKCKLDDLFIEELKYELVKYKDDKRIGVQKLINRYNKKISQYEEELERLYVMSSYERENENFIYIAGIDEAGRGPLCGPVVAAAVILPKNCEILYLNDSKKLSKQKREALYDEIIEKAISIGVGIINPNIIDEINILNATYKAMEEAIKKLSIEPDLLLIDAVRLSNINITQKSIIKGDEKSISIAAASIIAKVTRDKLMEGYDELFPEYAFSKNKGYGTSEHINALILYGPSPIHRQSFIKNII